MTDDNGTPLPLQREHARDEVIALAREELRVVRRFADRGGVRVRVSVEERDEAIDLLLREQQVQVERVPIGRVVEHPPATRQEGDTLIVPVVEEILVVERRVILKEEIRIRRTELQRPTRETARLRSEVADVEMIAASDS